MNVLAQTLFEYLFFTDKDVCGKLSLLSNGG